MNQNPRRTEEDIHSQYLGIWFVYGWGLKIAALLLFISAAVVVSRHWIADTNRLDWLPNTALLVLWSMPVLGLLIQSVRTLAQRPRSIDGWLAAVIAIVLIGLWL